MRGWYTAAFCAVIAAAAAGSFAETEPQDPPAVWSADISTLVAKPTALSFAPAGKFWEISARAGGVREGATGWAFHVQDNPDDNGTRGRAKIEVEALGDRKLAKAAADFAAAMPEILKIDQLEIVGTATFVPEAETFVFGKVKLQGHRVHCTFKQPGGADRTDKRFCVVLQSGKALISVSTERYLHGADYLTTVLEAMKFAPPAAKPVPATLKLLNMNDGIARYMTATVPTRWTHSAAQVEKDYELVFARRDPKTGELRSRITLLAQRVTPPFDLKNVAEADADACATKHDEATRPEPRTVGDREGFEIRYKDTTTHDGRPAAVRMIVVRRQDQRMQITLECLEQDAKELAADNAAFDQFLASSKMWTARVR